MKINWLNSAIVEWIESDVHHDLTTATQKLNSLGTNARRRLPSKCQPGVDQVRYKMEMAIF